MPIFFKNQHDFKTSYEVVESLNAQCQIFSYTFNSQKKGYGVRIDKKCWIETKKSLLAPKKQNIMSTKLGIKRNESSD